MDAKCRQFDSYNFAADQVFQRGLARLGETARASEERLLEAKIYYYSRFIRPIDLEGYKGWLSSQIIEPKNQNNSAAEDITKDFEKLLRQTPSDPGKNDHSATIETAKVSRKPPMDQQAEKMEDASVYFQTSKEIEGKGHTAPDQPTENSQIKEPPYENRTVGDTANLSATTTTMKGESCTLSFSEVLQLVQSGQEIPGIQKQNITPTNSMPTVSQMARKPKPWESV